jgi:hypothetical protein
MVAGLGIATLDLAVIGRRIPAIRALPQGRQWADHVAYGLAVGVELRRRRAARSFLAPGVSGVQQPARGNSNL